MRRRTPPPTEAATAPALVSSAATPHLIHPTAVYTMPQAQAALGLRASTIRRELREGRLRVSKRAGRYYLLGAWLLEWLRAGEVRRRPQTETNGALTRN